MSALPDHVELSRVDADIRAARGLPSECYTDPSFAKHVLGWEALLGVEAMCADGWKWQCWAAENLHQEPADGTKALAEDTHG